ncbi:hypothetical protein D1872_263970 [compost metagenome]
MPETVYGRRIDNIDSRVQRGVYRADRLVVVGIRKLKTSAYPPCSQGDRGSLDAGTPNLPIFQSKRPLL